MGQKITRLQPVGGFAAETAGAISLFTATALGVPVSTTHTITGAIVGVGSTRRLSAVRWGVAGRIVWAWILTIPAAGADRGGRRSYLLALRMPSEVAVNQGQSQNQPVPTLSVARRRLGPYCDRTLRARVLGSVRQLT